MPNLLVRGLSEEAVDRIDAEAGALGLSRNDSYVASWRGAPRYRLVRLLLLRIGRGRRRHLLILVILQ